MTVDEICFKFCSILKQVNGRIREDGGIKDNLNDAFSYYIDKGDVWGDHDLRVSETARIANEYATRRGGGGGRKNNNQGGKGRDGEEKKRTPEEAAEQRAQNDAAGKVCNNFNKNKCTRGKLCYFSHRCSRCGGDHPVTQCTQPAQDIGSKRKREQYQQLPYNFTPAPHGGPALPFAPVPPAGPPPGQP